MTWAGVKGCSTIVPKVRLVLGGRRESVGGVEGDQGGTVAGSAVDADISAAKARTEDGGAFLSLDFIVQG